MTYRQIDPIGYVLTGSDVVATVCPRPSSQLARLGRVFAERRWPTS